MSTCKCKNNQTDNLKELDEILETYGKKKGYLITILQKAQDAYGYISIDIMNRISEFTGIKVAKIYGVATFYAQFRLQPIGKYLIMLCQGTACHVNGSEMISQVISEQLNIKDGETTEDGLFTLNQVSCLGCCSLAPVMMIKTEDSDETYGNLTKDSVIEILNQIKENLKVPMNIDALLKKIIKENELTYNYKEYYFFRTSLVTCISYLADLDEIDYTLEDSDLLYYTKIK